ncbi:putative nucleic acid-binding Zn-ribbon protein [Microbacterium terrae]|uniref:Uncharacterized protein n=1 Tax=Microbacterium terrae TaxID=69369 RepID=A0A0M2GX29_9MICO|nr:hypothetical protein [Microbacterium terrae]KJL38478.1 hypothetical protein RS81_02752 [Microbacterium terrae]MBP1078879.1 putative nucleic acid-binding Zn-ribbon protein [Microbacterium terrae]GLJ98279.1 hypothetical protein GCM10017594_14760 [Microbacterium terrae]
MPELVASVLGWLVPAAVVFAVAALALAIGIWAVRRARRSPRARARAEAVRAAAGAELVRLDDAVDELDLEVGLSGALYGGEAPASLRRARLTSQHARDDAFDRYRRLSDPDLHPAEVRREAARVSTAARGAQAVIARARADHRDWVAANVSAADQVSAAEQRLDALQQTMGDPSALVADLSSRYADDEWQDAAAAARSALAASSEAGRLLRTAAAQAADPAQSALADLTAAERALRTAEADARALEEAHRLVTEAARALAGEFASAREALRQAAVVRERMPSAEGDRLADEIRAISAELDALETDADRRPTRTVDRIARLRDRLDLAVGDARTAQQRLRAARTALPGTIAAARTAVAQAETAITRARTGADARARLGAAQHELAAARRAGDPIEALDAARRAMRHAEDAKALADHDRLGVR